MAELPARTVCRFPLTAYLEAEFEFADGVAVLPLSDANVANLRLVARRVVVEHQGARVAVVDLPLSTEPITFGGPASDVIQRAATRTALGVAE